MINILVLVTTGPDCPSLGKWMRLKRAPRKGTVIALSDDIRRPVAVYRGTPRGSHGVAYINYVGEHIFKKLRETWAFA